jgi:hypothetical protein
MNLNWKFPSTKNNNLSPWYIVFRRSIWILPAYAARILFVVLVWLGWGYDNALDMWQSTK